MTDPDLPTRTEGEGETLDMPEGMRGFVPGQVLGERYQVVEMLGRGGMGEVWHAFDLKLRVEVALKALRPEFFKSERRLELLRQEVRAAREVVSPNVCRIFDLVEVEGRELVSMEYVDGATLLGVLQERGPLELKEAQDIASQFLAGLEAIHKAGLIHRDIKPENIMLTRAGRVVVMDFGLARQETEGGGTVSGTPAYMAPEQAAGQTLDARADVYAAGVVLAEMVSPDGIKSFESRQSVWEGVRSEPAKVPDTPWAQVIKQAVKKDREGRFNSAHTLTRALEDVTLRVEGAEDLHPYPGLASFTEADAEYFFGREAEVEQMWRKLEGPPRMLGLVGPSGAGKTSYLRAGLFPTATTRWATAICKPGNNPQLGLGRALAPAMAGDVEVMDLLLRFDDPDVAVEVLSRWRKRSERVLLVIDQFEELFTQNSAEVQRRFADLLNRLVLEADVHVLLSMRDDFMIRCRDFESLQSTFADLTALPTLSGAALRRALTQPALQCGYRFEDDELVEEMLAEVEGERGALPLAAFAAARLWEKRDRQTGLLTRQAYGDIGGVGGALARHAEATVDRIGTEHIGVVRELFRNLVTAEGTRAVREWDDLLSIFPDSRRESGAAVLRSLIDARLLTSYEVREDDREPTRRVEIIHESLLANWPRLVRWQTQDADAAQLRDQLRQAARIWDEHGRSNDLLWTGSAFREYALWRERYAGGLTDTEEAFTVAMTGHARRRKRRRRIAMAASFGVLLAVLGVVGVSRQQAIAESRRAKAANLVSLGQLALDSYPSATVAYAIASLEQADTMTARKLALDALWRGPTALVATEDFTRWMWFSPDGQWLVYSRRARAGDRKSHLGIVHSNGSVRNLETAYPDTNTVWITPPSATGHMMSFGSGAENTWDHVLWSLPDGRQLGKLAYREPAWTWSLAEDTSRNRHVLLIVEDQRVVVDTLAFDGSTIRLGLLEYEFLPKDEESPLVGIGAGLYSRDVEKTLIGRSYLDPRGRWIGIRVNNQALIADIDDEGLGPARLLGRHAHPIVEGACDPLGRFFATADAAGEIRLWDLSDSSTSRILRGSEGIRWLNVTADGSLLEAATVEDDNWIASVWDLSGEAPRFLRRFNLGNKGWLGWSWDTVGKRVARVSPDMTVRLWPMSGSASIEALVLHRGDVRQLNGLDFDPSGRMLATGDDLGLTLWPLTRAYPLEIRVGEKGVSSLILGPKAGWLAWAGRDGIVRLANLEEASTEGVREMGTGLYLSRSPDGGLILAGSDFRGARLLPVDDGPSRRLPGFDGQVVASAFSLDGRLVAGAGGQNIVDERAIRVWDVESGAEVSVLDVGEAPNVASLQFTNDGRLLSMSESGLLRWDIETGERELVYEGTLNRFAATKDGSRVVLVATDNPGNLDRRVVLLDVESGTLTRLEAFGNDVLALALEPDGDFLVTGDSDGEVRIGPLNGAEPHLLLGHERTVYGVSIDPQGRWIASGGLDEAIRLWPMPDLSKPPLHTLPHDELIAKLKSLTNLRAVRDEESSTGWKIEVGPFPGWETVPEW